MSIAILQEWFGLAVAGKCYGPRMLGIAGPAQSGKSTIAHVFYALLGASNTLSLTVPQLTGRYGLDNLARKRAAVIHSVCLNRKDSKTRRAIESLSRFCNQDFWQLNGRRWPIKINTRLMLIADNLSDLVDSEGVLSGDITRLETTQSFSGRQNIYLKEKLNAEMPGIFNWALDGFFRVQARGRFQASLIDQTFGIESRTADCQPGLFMQHCCRKADDARISCAQLYETYKRWSIRRGGVPLGRTGFWAGPEPTY